MSDEAPLDPRPARLTVAAALTAAEGAVIACFGLVSLVMLFIGDPDGLVQALTMALTVLALAALPLAAARGLWLLRRWSRGPALITQLLALPVGWQMAQNGGVWTAGGAAIGVVALVVLGCLVTPVSAAALGVGPRDA
ncbi:hypothetical protein RM572_04795 [Streptomyces sp. DSM 42041]|uniref:Integral membrane protein n=1 Tax=Streptomyces hazeniae TaxID=3075538 RepID=A0ABU2NR43_9ACTN|nr:hypothetical protein [Streptomyces sp. DSM 42041]MDT0378093.1 hypothetical protein [Streptomyces sp. DSM 42041]